MHVVRDVHDNANGGFQEPIKLFMPSKWACILKYYESELQAHGKCSIQQLALQASFGYWSAWKAIYY